MKIIKLIVLTIALSVNTVFAQEDNVNDSIQSVESSYLELPRIQVVPINDTKNDRQYELYIKLPEGYSENVYANYPVLYFTDALWHIEILSGSADFLMKNAILVGISWEKDLKGELAALGEHASRFRDYSVRPLSNPEAQAKYQFGQASNHLDFIRNNVIKYVENKYRTVPDNRSYFGYSAGGKFGAYILLTQPSTFKNYVLGSPSLSRGGRDIPILSKLEANEALNANVFITYGDLEKETSPYTDKIIAMLKNKNDESLLLKHEVIEGTHETAFPMTAVSSLKWLSQWLSPVNNYPLLEGPYFGQKLAGLTPEIFAPDIVSLKGRSEAAVSFSPDLGEMYFSTRKKDENWSVYFSRLENKKWTDLKKANFTKGKSSTETKPFVSPSGKRIYFDDGNGKVWFVNRLKDSWGDASQLDLPINKDKVFNLIEAKNGDLYFFNTSKRKQYYASNKNGKFPEAREVDIEFGVHCYISPTQDYLVVDARNENKDLDLYVYFKKQDGTWAKPINLGDKINSNFDEANPRITPDGKYLFFGRFNEEDESSNIYWVSTEVIHKLKTAYFKREQ